MTISTQERDIIRDILEMAETKTTHMLDEVMENPVSKYTDPKQLEQETQILFRKFPLIIGHISDVAEPGDFLTHDTTGVPILVTRTQDGVLKAFLNVCRHRGARLEDKPCGKARTFSCPYHSWTYGLDGKLRGMPHKEGFDGVAREDISLKELPVWERFGLIFVMPSQPDHEVDIDAWLAPLAEQLNGLSMDTHHVFRKWELSKNMSWRLLLEGFQESYHFCHAHRDTACAGYLDNQSIHLNFDPHVRHALPQPNIVELKDKPEEEWEYRKYFMTQNYIFPANFVQVQTDHIYIHTIIPTGPGTCVFQCMMLIAEEPKTEKAERYFTKNYDLIRVVFEEDFVIGEGIQKGLETGANSDFLFGKFECGLQFGQKAIDAALRGEITV
ncbi:aromatic ring-hydroxylating oxygenase subunit alpha [Tropicibacter naphthalenivorans]|uniref:3-phenylpropionate/cinnamic acid dioxygenase subunit alpha n=1 Tax=Tropicibacter naphthalenivorans TaxID=441103 RepID=A0A0P1GG76_9RHOB|nr:SRPBCC family protein [Tropicibacter naphthalenivorans]CUH80583.1 3-phenylpropionate/cinnamic acid dioxygenase subunit alpha [Tropicibacter naphthalenivorans]SMC88462.1 Phenylpropionate dioxygenase, large terminal subunit [Tropicibacter naphthalenivorans]